jgi:hypothetical protein
MRWWLALVVLSAGCDTLFPEFADKPPPAADMGAASSTPTIAGTLCALRDVRDLSSCGPARTDGLRVTVEETRQAAAVDLSGAFTLPLASALDTATLAAVDPTGTFLPTVMRVRLGGVGASGISVALIDAATVQTLALASGVALDPARGLVLAWATDATGAPVAGVGAASIAGASGPFYDGAAAGELDPVGPTRSHGLVALFDLAPASATLSLSPPATATVRDDSFDVPIRAGAVTMAVLVLPPR